MKCFWDVRSFFIISLMIEWHTYSTYNIKKKSLVRFLQYFLEAFTTYKTWILSATQIILYTFNYLKAFTGTGKRIRFDAQMTYFAIKDELLSIQTKRLGILFVIFKN